MEYSQIISEIRAITQKQWLTPDDLAEEFSITKSTQAKMRMKKTIPFSKIGAFVRYSRSEIDQWLRNAKVA